VTIDMPLSQLTPKGRATRDRIVGEAARLMFERGAAGTSIEDVKAAAGISSSQLYHYFADKQALVRAVIAHQTDAVLEAQQPLLGRLDSLEALRAWRDLAIEFQRRHHPGCPIGSLAGELAKTDPEACAAVADGFGCWESAIRDGLLALLAALQGGLLLTQVRRQTAPLEAALDAMLDHIASFTEPA